MKTDIEGFLYFSHQERLNSKQGNRGDMRKIHVTRQFFDASSPQGHSFEKSGFQIRSMGVRVPNFRYVSFSFGQ